MKPFKNTNNPKSTAKPLQGKAASFKVTQSISGVSTEAIKKATKNPAPAPKAGGFGRFIGQ